MSAHLSIITSQSVHAQPHSTRKILMSPFKSPPERTVIGRSLDLRAPCVYTHLYHSNRARLNVTLTDKQ